MRTVRTAVLTLNNPYSVHYSQEKQIHGTVGIGTGTTHKSPTTIYYVTLKLFK
jgi:hypothetical protein